jgi:phosphoglycerate dehydrogenase-like enzyme
MEAIPEKAAYLLDRNTKAFAFLALSLADGWPQVTSIWFDWDGAHVIINTARGPVVAEKALLKALDAKKLAGAALDVYECEPAIDCDLKDHLELKKLPNVILTPHVASATVEAREAMSRVAAENIIAALQGKSVTNLAK